MFNVWIVVIVGISGVFVSIWLSLKWIVVVVLWLRLSLFVFLGRGSIS